MKFVENNVMDRITSYNVCYTKLLRESINDLDGMRIVTPSGERVNFKDIAVYTIERGDVAINHLDGQREIQVTSDLKNPSSSATDIIDYIKTNIIPVIQSKYPTISASFDRITSYNVCYTKLLRDFYILLHAIRLPKTSVCQKAFSRQDCHSLQ